MNLESSPCFKITYWPANRTLCMHSTMSGCLKCFKTYSSYSGMKSFLLRSAVLSKCVVVGWCSVPSHSATSTDQGEDTGQHVAKKGLQNICVYPPVKPSELYLPQSNIPSTETSQEEKEVPSEIRSVLLYLQTEATPNALRTMQTQSVALSRIFFHAGLIYWFIFFSEKTQIGKQHLEGVWPLREWKDMKKGKNGGGWLDSSTAFLANALWLHSRP